MTRANAADDRLQLAFADIQLVAHAAGRVDDQRQVDLRARRPPAAQRHRLADPPGRRRRGSRGAARSPRLATSTRTLRPSRSSVGEEGGVPIRNAWRATGVLPSAQVSVTGANGTGRPAASRTATVSTRRGVDARDARKRLVVQEDVDIGLVELGIEEVVVVAGGEQARRGYRRARRARCEGGPTRVRCDRRRSSDGRRWRER